MYLFDMPNIKEKELVHVLLEEMMPHCEVEGLLVGGAGPESPSQINSLLSHRLEALVSDGILEFHDPQS